MGRKLLALCVILAVLALIGAALSEDVLGARLGVLRRLDIEISDDAEKLVRRDLSEVRSYYPNAGVEEFLDYTYILSWLGTGDYDRATWAMVPVTDGVYAFDTEMFSIEEGYMDLLGAVERMSGGSIGIADFRIAIDDEMWTRGKGRFPIEFSLNGQPCRYMARLQSDWMDLGLLDYLGDKVKAVDDGRQLWFMHDGGQGMIMFYRDAEWAARFEAATGCRLYANQAEVMGL